MLLASVHQTTVIWCAAASGCWLKHGPSWGALGRSSEGSGGIRASISLRTQRLRVARSASRSCRYSASSGGGHCGDFGYREIFSLVQSSLALTALIVGACMAAVLMMKT